MKLYILEATKSWEPWYDTVDKIVVRASTSKQARKLAASVCGDEGADVWTEPKRTSCKQLTNKGPAEVILRDFQAG